MPADMQKLNLEKEKIIQTIQNRGPLLPIQVARDVNLNLLFASAYLSELYNENKVKMSNTRVGSSSLYYVSGQEPLLENFTQYLNSREKEAHAMVKSQKILEDEKIEPAMRVAIRAIKDFAIPLRVNTDAQQKLFWKYFLVSDDEAKALLQERFENPESKKDRLAKAKEDHKDKQKTLESQESAIEEPKPEKHKHEKIEKKEEHSKQSNTIEELKQKLEELSQNIKNSEKAEQTIKPTIKEKKQKVIEESKFVKNIREHLSAKSIEITEQKEIAKKEFIAKIRIDSLFGKQEFLLIAKEKKKISEEDITLALHKAQLEKMPALLMAPGDLDKKSIEHANTWKNLVKFEKLSF